MEPAAGGRHEVRGGPRGRLGRTAAQTSLRHLPRPAAARGEEGASAANVCCPEPAGGTVRCPASHPDSWNRGHWSRPATEIGPRRACRALSASGPDTKDFHVPSGSLSSLSP